MTDIRAYRQIGLIGTGRVARALGLALAPHSIAPILIQGRNPDHATAAARAIGHATARPLSSSLSSSRSSGCDILLIAVADDAIAPVVDALAAGAIGPPARFIAHVSGRSGAALLDPLRTLGVATAAIHPAMTFTGDPATEVQRMRDARFALTAPDAPAMAHARSLVALLGGFAVEVAEEHRALYHAALCHAANHLVTLIAGASDALVAAGIEQPGALLAPLVHAALGNSLDRGIDALSGPLLRGDRATIGNHLAALATHDPALLPAYRAMALATLDALGRQDDPLRDDLSR